ncbi:helix-turn-helix domain-containing protein [Actinoplanes ianthinogenes]|uniref:helix-turn-helix domain-containing protein n=1 Tax=Actinoplanes ianthinogenes TaxID=122358 RepID=UPI0016707AC0|nr:helix-turn-helix transcriptional regulator [Actinoplanes ianthinogenes]
MRKLRKSKGLTLEDVAKHFDWSPAKVSRIELGRVAVTTRDARDLAIYYGVDDETELQTLRRLARGSRQRDWWHAYNDVLPKQFGTYLGLEAEAASIHAWEPLLIPGLLQTAAYARALVVAHRAEHNEGETERRVEARMERQDILSGEEAPFMQAVLGESALRRQVGGRDVMRDQLAFLAKMTERQNVQVHIVPYSAGAYMPMEGGFQMLRFADPEAAPIVCIDLLTRNLYLDDVAEVGRYRDAWEDVLTKALPHTESAAMIKAAAEEMEK